MRTMLAVLAITLPCAAFGAEQDHGFWWYQEAKLACMGDVLRLCREFVPDEDKTRSCMKGKKALVSASCAAFYPGGSKD